MSAWWLLLIVPAAGMLGITIMCAASARSYDRGYADGHRAGWQDSRGGTAPYGAGVTTYPTGTARCAKKDAEWKELDDALANRFGDGSVSP